MIGKIVLRRGGGDDFCDDVCIFWNFGGDYWWMAGNAKVHTEIAEVHSGNAEVHKEGKLGLRP